MSVTKEQLDSFHRFASEKLDNGGSDVSWQELFQLWQLENSTDEERAEVNAIIRQGDEDIAAGRGRPADEVNDELRRKYNLSAE